MLALIPADKPVSARRTCGRIHTMAAPAPRRALRAERAGIVGLLAILAGCHEPHPATDTADRWPFRSVQRLAVAPAMNFSGQESLDPVRVADLLASELTQSGGVTIVPVNRVAAALIARGGLHVRSPAAAYEVCRAVGADAMLISAITEYQPFPPMIVGATFELFVLPEAAARRASANGDIAVDGPAAQVQLTWDASQTETVRRVRAFGERRDSEAGPMGWRRYLVTQEGFLRFCAFEGINALISGESDRMATARLSDARE